MTGPRERLASRIGASPRADDLLKDDPIALTMALDELHELSEQTGHSVEDLWQQIRTKYLYPFQRQFSHDQ